jgi:chromosome segregation ATPase
MMKTDDKVLKDKLDFVASKTHEIESLEKENKQMRLEVREKDQLIQDKNGELSECKRDMDKLEQDIRQSVNQLREIRSNNNRAGLLADYMPQLLNQIRSSRNFKETVYGPIGLAVTIKEGFQKYSRAIERILGPALRSFVVSNMPDSNVLSRLQQECNVRGSVSTFVQNRSSRYNVPECDSEMTSFLDAITINDDLVYNALVDQFQIDRIYLANDEEDVLRRYVVRGQNGNDGLKNEAHSVVTLDGTTVRYMNGNQASEVSRYPCKNLLIGDMSQTITAMEQEIEHKQVRLTHAQQLFQQFKNELNASNQEIAAIKQDLMAAAKRIQSLTRSKQAVQEEISNIDEINRFDITPLELEKETSLKAIETIETNLGFMKEELTEKKKEIAAMQKEKTTMENDKQRLFVELKAIEDKIDFIINNRNNLKTRLSGLQTKLKEKTATIVQENDILLAIIEELNQQKETAMRETQSLLGEDTTKWNFNPEKLSKNDTKAILEKNIKKLKYEIAEYKKEMNLKGYTLEILEERYKNLFDEYSILLETLEKLKENYSLISDNQKQRQDKWLKALKESTEITKKKFDYYVQQKGSTGFIKFNHKDRKLEISYQVDYNDKESKANDIRNLSGGERSFVTFSVLLALGHVVRDHLNQFIHFEILIFCFSFLFNCRSSVLSV